jgi:hypothetical protein
MRKAVQIPGLRHSQTLLGEFKDREHLLPLHALEPQYKVVHTGSVFEILEKSLYWHAGPRFSAAGRTAPKRPYLMNWRWSAGIVQKIRLAGSRT